jgi:hypothetical protein
MSLRLKRAMHWDADKEEVIGDKEASNMAAGLTRSGTSHPYRAPWDAALRACIKVSV